MGFIDSVMVMDAILGRKKWRGFFLDACSFNKADAEDLERIRQRRLAIIEKYGVLSDTKKYEAVFVRAGKVGSEYWKKRWVPELTRKGLLNPKAFNVVFPDLLELFSLEEYWQSSKKMKILRPDF